MKVGILETGEPPAELESRFGRYDAMFARLLGEGFQTVTYEVTRGQFPANPEEHEAYLITGSPAGVYDDLPWIEPLKAFLRSAKGKARLIGVCFGHQIMAEAFGGKVEKSERGWGIGLHSYWMSAPAPWADGRETLFVEVSHQDQIVVQPPETRIVAASPFTPYAMLAYENQPAISMQCHPEFTKGFAAALIEHRRARLPDPDAAIASLDHPDDSDALARWIRGFIRGEA